MSGKIGVLIIHGMGRQPEEFSTGLRDELQDRLGNLASRFKWEDIYWAEELEKREKNLWNIMRNAENEDKQPIDLDWVPLRKFVVHYFGDALAYQRDISKPQSAYALIHKLISGSIDTLNNELNDSDAPIIVLAHSLGAHIMSNYIWDQQHDTGLPFTPIPNLLAMITFGCNIPLFSLAFPVAKPINLPGEGITNPSQIKVSKWQNFLDSDDVLGWPLKPLYKKNLNKLSPKQKKTVSRIVDHEISVGSIFTSWNPGAHTDYWTDDDFTVPVATYLGQVFEALDR